MLRVNLLLGMMENKMQTQQKTTKKEAINIHPYQPEIISKNFTVREHANV